MHGPLVRRGPHLDGAGRPAPTSVGLNAEADVIRLTDGRLYALMRSFTDDMYDAISDDEAKSWSEAKKVGSRPTART